MPRHLYDATPHADSIVVDPHKHGLQPYGCGCVLFKDPSVGRFYKHDSPYTYFTSAELHLGEISLECSRAGAAAVALWATQRLLAPWCLAASSAQGAWPRGPRRCALEVARRAQARPALSRGTRAGAGYRGLDPGGRRSQAGGRACSSCVCSIRLLSGICKCTLAPPAQSPGCLKQSLVAQARCGFGYDRGPALLPHEAGT